MAYVEKLTVDQAPEYTLRVLVYEVGNISKCLIYQDRFGKTGYVGETKLHCAHVLTQISLLIEQLGFDLEECREIGMDRFKHRMMEYKEAEEKRKNATDND